jgi:hypothetical protein
MPRLMSANKAIFETLIKKERVLIEVDEAPLELLLYADGNLIRAALFLGTRTLPKDLVQVLFEEESGRAWLKYDVSGAVYLIYEGANDPTCFISFSKRFDWLIRVGCWLKKYYLEGEVVPT